MPRRPLPGRETPNAVTRCSDPEHSYALGTECPPDGCRADQPTTKPPTGKLFDSAWAYPEIGDDQTLGIGFLSRIDRSAGKERQIARTLRQREHRTTSGRKPLL